MKSTLLSLCTVLLVSSSAQALSFDVFSALSTRPGFDSSSVPGGSYDNAPQNNGFSPFGSKLSNATFALDSFTGGAAGFTHELTLLAEVTCYDGNEISGVGNQFGFIDQGGNFQTAIDINDNPGTTVVIEQGANEQLTFGANSPESLFSTIDSDNEDVATHIVARVVEEAGVVAFNHANYAGTVSSVFNLQVGDIVFFVEDLLASGNQFVASDLSDFDYQDGVLVLRSTPKEIPEPMTMALVGGGLLAAARKRRQLLAQA